MAGGERQPQLAQPAADVPQNHAPASPPKKQRAAWKEGGMYLICIPTFFTYVRFNSEQQVLPHNNIPLVFFGLMMTTFLVFVFHSSLNSSQCLPGSARSNNVCIFNRGSFTLIYVFLACSVSTALPTIVGQLGGGNDYSWVGR